MCFKIVLLCFSQAYPVFDQLHHKLNPFRFLSAGFCIHCINYVNIFHPCTVPLYTLTNVENFKVILKQYNLYVRNIYFLHSRLIFTLMWCVIGWSNFNIIFTVLLNSSLRSWNEMQSSFQRSNAVLFSCRTPRSITMLLVP